MEQAKIPPCPCDSCTNKQKKCTTSHVEGCALWRRSFLERWDATRKMLIDLLQKKQKG